MAEKLNIIAGRKLLSIFNHIAGGHRSNYLATVAMATELSSLLLLRVRGVEQLACSRSRSLWRGNRTLSGRYCPLRHLSVEMWPPNTGGGDLATGERSIKISSRMSLRTPVITAHW